MTIDNSDNMRSDTKVLLNGKEIGMLNEVSSTGDNKVLDLGIYEGAEIPSGAFVSYFENVLSGAYISFTFPDKSIVLKNIMPNDTIKLGPLKHNIKTDTTTAKILVKIISDVINVVDSNLRKTK
jgi:hypothetical protein